MTLDTNVKFELEDDQAGRVFKFRCGNCRLSKARTNLARRTVGYAPRSEEGCSYRQDSDSSDHLVMAACGKKCECRYPYYCGEGSIALKSRGDAAEPSQA